MPRPRLAGLAIALLFVSLAAAGDTPGLSPAPKLPSRTSHAFPAYAIENAANDASPRDDVGIPMVVYDGTRQYNPVTIEQAALYDYGNWLTTGSPARGREFMQYADWLVANQTTDGLWLYDFAFHDQPVPWWSAMAQGQGISVLVRAASVSGDPGYLAAARLAISAFHRPLSSRGVVASGGGAWFEEYMPPAYPHVLNGMVFAMLGPYEYFESTGDRDGLDIWNAGVETLAGNLWRYDSGSWSYYDAVGTIAPMSYHQLHIKLLALLYRITGRPVFETYRARFQAYLDARTPPPG